MKLQRANKPHHGQGEHGRVRTHHGLMGGPSGAHMPQRKNSGFDDRKGYSDNTAERRNGALAGGKLKSESDTRRRSGSDGNGKGSPPPGVGKRKPASLAAHAGDSGRGGAGRLGMHDGHKGPQPKKLSEDISHSAFERLGAD